jgi:hypothetical protein
MISYRFKRRAFLTAMSGGVGLKILLRNMEASAQTSKSPARLLVSHWPVGIVAGSGDALFAATSGSIGGSMGLQPFTDNNLGPDMTVIKGISTPIGQGGSHEGGTPALMTGVACPGTRSGEAESDDGYAGGPSFEQIILGAGQLKAPGAAISYVNAAADTRTDFGEVSTKCLSYATQKQTVSVALGPSPAQENIPLPPNLSPVNLYNTIFNNFVPPAFIDPNGTASAPPAADTILTNLASRRSVLDFAKTEIDMLRQMAPGEARTRLDLHFDAIQQMEDGVRTSIDNGYPPVTGGGGMAGSSMAGMAGMGGSTTGMAGRGGTTGNAGAGGRGGTTGNAGAGGRGGTTGAAGMGGTTGTAGTTGTGGGAGGGGNCRNAMVKPGAATGVADPMRGAGNNYTDPTKGATEDATNLSAVGKAHMSVLKAAFICDIVRCGTMLWAPGTNHVGFKGLFPGQTSTVYQHHPQSHKIYTSDVEGSASLTSMNASAQFLFAVQQWFFRQMAESLKDWKNSYDGFGNSLLDFTAVPYVTEVRATGHERNSMPAMIIGGKSLGFAHNKYVKGSFSVNQFWGLIGPAVGYTSTAAPFAAPGSTLSALWVKPA